VGGSAFFEQERNVISRFKSNPTLFEALESIFHSPFDSSGSELLYSILRFAGQVQFERRLDVLVSTLRAFHELRLKHFETPAGKRFIDAVRTLAIKLGRPPAKVEITSHLCCEPSQTSKWCQDHGFSWLPNAPAGRPKRSRRTQINR
jgi:hypothetical protein